MACQSFFHSLICSPVDKEDDYAVICSPRPF